MVRRWPRRITVCIDDAEQKPEEFPDFLHWFDPSGKCRILEVRTREMPLLSREAKNLKRDARFLPRVGDYALGGSNGQPLIHHGMNTDRYCVVAEKKGRWKELHENFRGCRDARRFFKAIVRLKEEVVFPLLYISFPFRFTERERKEQQQSLDDLFMLCARMSLPLLAVPPAKNPLVQGEILLRAMWQRYVCLCLYGEPS